MRCWNVVDDLKDIEQELKSAKYTPQQTAALVGGLQLMYSRKFEELFEMFETSFELSAKVQDKEPDEKTKCEN